MLRRIHDVAVFKNISSKIIRANSNIDLDHFYLKVLSGLVSECVEYKSIKDQIKNYSLYDLIQDSGEWMGIFENINKKDYVICSDFYGFSQIFYAIFEVEDKFELVLSNSFRGVASYLNNSNVKLSVNWNCVLPHLITNQNLFLTRASDETFAKQIYVLKYNEFMYIKDGIIYKINKREEIGKENQNYKDLILKGVNKAIIQFENWTTDRDVCFNLSGGKDSRAVLSMLLNSRNKKEIKISTRNPFNISAGPSKDIFMKDFTLSSKMVEKYDLEWFKRNNYKELKLTYREQLNIWQDFRSNSSFELKCKSRQIKNCNELRIMGIGGELIRSYLGESYKANFPQWWSKVNNENLSREEKLALLFRELCHPWLIDSNLYSSAQEHFINSFSLNKGNVLAQLDESYLAYRSRAHAGVGGVHNFDGAILKYPLCQVEFLYASELLDDYERDNGRALFDIIAMTNPELNYLDFASPKWPESFFKNQAKYNWSDIDETKTIETYKQNMQKKAIHFFDDRNISNYIMDDVGLEKLKENLYLISSLCSNDFDFTPLVERIARLHQKNSDMLHAFVAKTESILDVIAPQPVHKNTVFFDCNNSSSINYTSKNIFEIMELNRVLHKIDLSKCIVDLKHDVDSNRLILTLNNMPKDCSRAVYVYMDGVREHVEWYEKQDIFLYDLKNRFKNHIRMMVFIKRDGEPEAQKIMNVELNI